MPNTDLDAALRDAVTDTPTQALTRAIAAKHRQDHTPDVEDLRAQLDAAEAALASARASIEEIADRLSDDRGYAQADRIQSAMLHIEAVRSGRARPGTRDAEPDRPQSAVDIVCEVLNDARAARAVGAEIWTADEADLIVRRVERQLGFTLSETPVGTRIA